MAAGKIIEMGTHAELLSQNGKYRKLYELQFADEEEMLAGVQE
jgi:ABC-type multidrug transport system fused ATPase/permease subunit